MMRFLLILVIFGYFSTTFGNPVAKTTTTSRPLITVEHESSEEDETDLDHEWSCGTDAFSMLVAESTVDKDCPTLKNEMNNCCFEHDTCYDAQKGQKFCDDTFCDCLSNVTAKHKTCHEEDAPVFCNLVRELGESAYLASGPNGTRIYSENAEEDMLGALMAANETVSELNRFNSTEYY